jgi:hypothetical protein
LHTDITKRALPAPAGFAANNFIKSQQFFAVYFVNTPIRTFKKREHQDEDCHQKVR